MNWKWNILMIILGVIYCVLTLDYWFVGVLILILIVHTIMMLGIYTDIMEQHSVLRNKRLKEWNSIWWVTTLEVIRKISIVILFFYLLFAVLKPFAGIAAN